MSPCLAGDDLLNCLLSDSKHSSNFALRVVAALIFCSHIANLFVCEDAAIAHFSARHSSLRHHVGIVVCSCSDEQMFNIDAWRIVAAMQDVGIVINRAIDNYPCEPMRQNSQSVTICRYQSIVESQGSVTASVSSACPEDATICGRLAQKSLKSHVFWRIDPKFVAPYGAKLLLSGVFVDKSIAALLAMLLDNGRVCDRHEGLHERSICLEQPAATTVGCSHCSTLV